MQRYPYNRVFLIVMDSVGIGEAKDAAAYGDEGADTLGNIAKRMNGLQLPNLEKMGLGAIKQAPGIEKEANPTAFTGIMHERSQSKDTMTGHWELMGLYIDQPFRTFPDGFPPELVEQLETLSGRGVIGNKVASGTEILDELGEEHMKTGDLIVYTSADSVLQIAAHEDVVPVEELHDICEKARAITYEDPYMIGRVIARPFVGTGAGAFERTPNRHDYALKPFGRTVMNDLADQGFDSIALGKITDIYDGEGITETVRTDSNEDGMDKLMDSVKQSFTGLSFLNLVDFDAKFGHRRDVEGYAKALENFDARLPEVLEALDENDLLLITADHGNDPTHHGTDHTREIVPLIAYSPSHTRAGDLGERDTFADVGATIAENFGVSMPPNGTSFLNELKATRQ
ncbi:phosphopentomutase [Salsuginibacillus halophilus]|uniref:Phosphopentomutase n=1 Tax=Salsuginibacillus halophilus TaxID=517424 RepID=A0A2P8HAT6_9BACI|nr:phosphopentomutase [Salsuginibacillus halophilus]PSL43291.1 phosphopentomutase [Salsuginibacillus halophilus]